MLTVPSGAKSGLVHHPLRLISLDSLAISKLSLSDRSRCRVGSARFVRYCARLPWWETGSISTINGTVGALWLFDIPGYVKIGDANWPEVRNTTKVIE
jgi:hypothetical protein